MLKTRAPASSDIGPGEGTRRAPISAPWTNKLQSTKITQPGRISKCLSYICSFKKNTASFKLFVVGQVTPYKPSIYFNKCGYMVLPILINKSKEVCIFTSSNVVYNTVDSAVSALYGQLLTQANTLLKLCSN